MVLFLAIGGSIFHNTAKAKVGKVLPDAGEEEIGALVAGATSQAFESLSQTEKDLVTPQIANAMKGVWAFFLAAAALSFVCSIPLLVRFSFTHNAMASF